LPSFGHNYLGGGWLVSIDKCSESGSNARDAAFEAESRRKSALDTVNWKRASREPDGVRGCAFSDECGKSFYGRKTYVLSVRGACATVDIFFWTYGQRLMELTLVARWICTAIVAPRRYLSGEVSYIRKFLHAYGSLLSAMTVLH
jgi:hypothetical protein